MISGMCGAVVAPQGTACGGGGTCDAAGQCVACSLGAAACCLQQCETQDMAAYIQFIGHELLSCGCATPSPCAASCTAECVNPQSLTAGSPCGTCLEAQVVMGTMSPCTFKAGNACLGSSACAPFVQCGLACP
jgi:hypothetical protein